MHSIFRGIFATPVVPFTGGWEIDVPGMERGLDAMRRLKPAGWAGPAVSGEATKLSAAEEDLVVDAMLRVAGDAPVFARVGADAPAAMARRGEQLLKRGCRGLLVWLPTEPAAMTACLDAIHATGVEHLVVVDMLERDWGLPMPALLDGFSKMESWGCTLMEGPGSDFKAGQLREATDGAMAIWGGWRFSELPAGLDRGFAGFLSGGPLEPWLEIYQAWVLEEDPEAAQDRYEEIVPFLAWAEGHTDRWLHVLKCYGVERGWFRSSALRQPCMEWDAWHQAQAEAWAKGLVAALNR